MGNFSEFVTRADALADETFTEYKVMETRFKAAEKKRHDTPVRHGIVNADYAAKAARAEADYLEAQKNYDTVKRGLYEKSKQMAAIRNEFVAAVDKHFAADPAKMDMAAITLMDSGIMKPHEYAKLMDEAIRSGNYTMQRLIAAKAGEMADKAKSDEAARGYKAVFLRGRNVDGSEYVQAFDNVVFLFDRCLKNPSLYTKWDELVQPVRDAL